jgi:3-hydroxymyristoyl/3-hydroxydecanoyl-(acyl carrier protein) dehydratase
VVKIAGRRVSIADVETHLRAHEAVSDAAVAAIPAPEGREFQLVAAVVAPRDALPSIRAHLLERFEPSCTPRKLIAVHELSREPNGKLPRARLLRLFKLDEQGQPIDFTIPWSAPRTEVTDSHEAHVFDVTIPERYGWFEGHFPGYPLLAGAVQIKELVLPAVTRAFPELSTVTEMSNLKFTGRILPGDALVVRVARERGQGAVHFEVKNASATCTTGKIAFRAEASA